MKLEKRSPGSLGGFSLTLTLLQGPQRATITTSQMALIAFLGAGNSGARHPMAFDMLMPGVGFPKSGHSTSVESAAVASWRHFAGHVPGDRGGMPIEFPSFNVRYAAQAGE